MSIPMFSWGWSRGCWHSRPNRDFDSHKATKPQRNLSSSVCAELVEAPCFFSPRKGRTALRQAQGERCWGLSLWLFGFVRVKIRLSAPPRSEEHTSELQSLMRNSYAGFCLKKEKDIKHVRQTTYVR